MSGEVRAIAHDEIRRHPVLLAEYAAECSRGGLRRPNPQWEMYAALEATGTFRVFGAYAYTELVGFATLLCYVLPHYGVKVGLVESLFVRRGNRAGGFGVKVMAALEQAARGSGCVEIYYTAPAHGQLEAVLERDRNCTRTNSIFRKSLAGDAHACGDIPSDAGPATSS